MFIYDVSYWQDFCDQFKLDDLESQLGTKDKIIQQLSESLKDKERQMQQCMEIFRPTPQVHGQIQEW